MLNESTPFPSKITCIRSEFNSENRDLKKTWLLIVIYYLSYHGNLSSIAYRYSFMKHRFNNLFFDMCVTYCDTLADFEPCM